MIQIDLGKDKLRGGGGGGSAIGRAIFGKLGKLKIGGGGGGLEGGANLRGGLSKIGSLVGNASGITLLLGAAGFAVMPHIAFTRYKAFLESQHAERVAEFDKKLSSVAAEIAKLLPYKKELESYEAQKKLVQDRIAAIQTLLKARSAPVSFMDAVGQSLPQRAWLNSVSFDLGEGKNQIVVKGQSLANEDVSDYVDRLNESTYLRDVSLDQVASKNGGASDFETKAFEITMYPKSAPRAPASGAPGAVPGAAAGAPVPPNPGGVAPPAPK